VREPLGFSAQSVALLFERCILVAQPFVCPLAFGDLAPQKAHSLAAADRL
jgi:hypothetical protein